MLAYFHGRRLVVRDSVGREHLGDLYGRDPLYVGCRGVGFDDFGLQPHDATSLVVRVRVLDADDSALGTFFARGQHARCLAMVDVFGSVALCACGRSSNLFDGGEFLGRCAVAAGFGEAGRAVRCDGTDVLEYGNHALGDVVDSADCPSFSLAASNILYLCLVFVSLISMCLGMFLLGFILYWILCASWT